MRETAITQWVKPKGYALAITTIRCQALHLHLNLAHGPLKEFKRFIRDEADYQIQHEAATAIYVFTTNESGNMDHWIDIPENEWCSNNYGAICHELHHFVHQGLDDLGVKYGEGGEEIYAYLQGYFMEQVVRAFVALKKANKPAKKTKKQRK